MQIIKQPNMYKSKINICFNGNVRALRDTSGKIKYRNNTSFFRPDLNWNMFTEMLIEKYKNVGKVNIYDYACSEGAEPFSLAMLLIKKLGEEKAQKFFPIIASDIDSEILKNPQNGILKLTRGDVFLIKRLLKKDYNQFIEFNDKFEYNSELNMVVCDAKIKPILENKVVFSSKNVVEDIANVEKNNSIVLFRNFWPYLLKSDRTKLADSVSECLGNNSICVIGRYDTHKMRMNKIFKSRGLIRVKHNHLCYIKPNSSNIQESTDSGFLTNILQKIKKIATLF